jgi:hypothetical protein
MPATLREPQLSDLDFTDTVVVRAEDAHEGADDTERLLRHLDTVIDAIALKIELGHDDIRLWRTLAGFYLANDRAADYNDLARKYLAKSGVPLRLDQPAVSFTLPVKVNFDDIPKLDAVRSASASPAGAVIDFGAVRRLSAGGLIALTELLSGLGEAHGRLQLRGVEAFIDGIERAIGSGQGTQEMQELARAYKSFVASSCNHPPIKEQGPASS